MRMPLENGPKLVVGQPNSSYRVGIKKKELVHEKIKIRQ